MEKKRLDIFKFLTIFSLFLMPLFFAFLVIILNNYEKYDAIFKTIIVVILLILTIILIISFLKLVKDKRIFNKNNLVKKIEFFVLILLYVSELSILIGYVYYNKSFKDWLIKTSLNSISYQDLAGTIYSQDTIDEVLPGGEEVVKDIIDFDVDYDINIYANEYEKEILERDKDAAYKIIKITGQTISSKKTYVGYLAVIYDPSKVKVAKSSGAGTFEGAYGETLATIASKNNALVAINAGGFYDPDWNSNGGIPHGDVFIDGNLDSSYVRGDFGGGMIGFDKDNKLVLRRMSTEEAIEAGIRDGVDWGPFLIVDGVNRFASSGSSWECPRTAIGQRKDGIVLFLVIDGLQEHSIGASYRDLAAIMERYGAINAANLDGGTSASMVEGNKYINSPWNGYRPTFRRFPNAFILSE